jgi:hypothetical protein
MSKEKCQGYTKEGSLAGAFVFGIAGLLMSGFSIQSLIIGAVIGAIAEPFLHGGPNELKIGDIIKGNTAGKTLKPDMRCFPYRTKSKDYIIEELEEEVKRLKNIVSK